MTKANKHKITHPTPIHPSRPSTNQLAGIKVLKNERKKRNEKELSFRENCLSFMFSLPSTKGFFNLLDFIGENLQSLRIVHKQLYSC